MDFYNINSIQNSINNYMESHTSVAVMLIADIDNFKDINNTLGYFIGDLILKNIHTGLKRLFRNSDIIGRIGGDEYLLFLTDLPDDFALQSIIDDVFFVISNALSQTDIEHDIRCSIGCASYPTDGATYFELYKKADTALYHAKQNSENSFKLHNPTMLAESGLCSCRLLNPTDTQGKPTYAETKKHIQRELSSDMYDIFLQPKVPLNSSNTLQAEALIRYHHPEKGYILPPHFIPTLEDMQLIYLIDLFVFEKILALLSSLEITSELPSISLNFSRYTLAHKNIISQMKEIMAHYNVPHELIEIEVTESIGNMNVAQFLNVCNQIRSMGFRLSLDDFGSAYSNIFILTALQFDSVKLDKNIVEHLLTDERNSIIAKQFFRTCKELGLHSVAEGVETKEQLDFLKQCGCDFAQGYYFDKPMEVDKFRNKYLFQK